MEFVLLLVCSLLLTARAAASDAVLDVDGDEVQTGQLYYALSVMRPGGGLTVAAVNEACPHHVAQAPSNDLSGRRFALIPENDDDDVIREGSTLNIRFAEPTGCSESSTWKLDAETGFVTTGGSRSSSIGPHSSRFAVSRAEDSDVDYQINVCPCSVGADRPSCRMGCLGSLGLTEQDGNILLSLNADRPHTIKFAKANQQATSMIRSAVARPK